MKRIATAIILIGIGTGCTEIQRQQADQLVADVNDIAAGAQAVLQSPAGGMIPTPAKEIAGLVIGLAGAGAATWAEWRRKTMAKTSKAIVRGIEQVDRQHKQANPDNPAQAIKAQIAANMKALGIQDRGDRIVNKLKIS